MDATREHVAPLYMALLHANFLHDRPDPQAMFAQKFRSSVRSVSDEQIAVWLDSPWRERLTAAWIVAARRGLTHRDKIAQLLLASKTCFAGQGLCVATARFGDERACDTLVDYLSIYLPALQRQYDQEWAIGCLAWLDRLLGAKRAAQFVDQPDLWKLTMNGKDAGTLDPIGGIKNVAEVMEFLGRLDQENAG